MPEDLTKVQVVDVMSVDELWRTFMDDLTHNDERQAFLNDWFPSARYNASELREQWKEIMTPKLGVQTGTSQKRR